ncbi:S8 family serine peptidase [soil metagenome]
MVVCRLFLLLLLVNGSLFAQSDRYMVFFKDKNSSPYSISQPSAFLSAKAIARRNHSAIAVTSEDLPVNAAYVNELKLSRPGVRTFFTSRWMNAVLVEASLADIAAIRLLPIVSKADLVAPGVKLIGGRLKELKQKQVNGDAPGVTQTQLEMVGMNTMHSENIYGEGVTVSILDSGFPGVNTAVPFQPIFTENRMKLTKDFVTNSPNAYQFDKHGTEVFSVIAAQLQGTFLGGAFKANYMLFVTEDVSSEYRIEEYNWLFAAEKADSAGTDVIQSSLGYYDFDDAQMNYTKANMDGKTTVVSKAAAMARDRGIIVVVSAGNEGNNAWGIVTAPADVDGILAIGAVNTAGVRTSFSSTGPTADGRIKPDVVALGQSTSVILPTGAVSTQSGTSLAAPLITSLVMGLLQAYPELTPAEIIQAIKLSANKSNSPDNKLGYGLPHYIAVKNYLESNKATDDIYIYPNPTDSMLTLSFKKLPDGAVDLSIYDVQGRLLSNPVGSLNWQLNPVDISLSSLPAGTYLLKVKTSTTIKTFRFVKL